MILVANSPRRKVFRMRKATWLIVDRSDERDPASHSDPHAASQVAVFIAIVFGNECASTGRCLSQLFTNGAGRFAVKRTRC